MKTLLGSLLALSLALNVFLWSRLARHSPAPQPQAAGRGEIEELRRQNQELEARRKAATDAADAAALPALRAQAAELQAQVNFATQNLAEANRRKLPPEHIHALIVHTSWKCTSNLQQVALAARFWAVKKNQEVFPPDFLAMKDEIGSPQVLFCPSNPTAIPFSDSDWSELNPAEISYQYLIPNSPLDGQVRQAFICPIHGHVAMSDGSVLRK